MARAIDAAVSAAQAADADAFAAALADLARVDHEQLTIVLGTLTRELIERSHPDGLDSDDAEQMLESAIRSAVGWYPGIDSDAFIWALTGALGIGDLDELPERSAPSVMAHGLLLIADLLRGSGQSLPPVLDGALSDLRRSQQMEMP